MDKLSVKRQAVLALLIADPKRNMTKAYKAVYGCEQSTAERNGSRLLKNAEFCLALQAELDKIKDEALITAKEIFKNLSDACRKIPKDHPSWSEWKGITELTGKHLGMFKNDGDGEVGLLKFVGVEIVSKNTKENG